MKHNEHFANLAEELMLQRRTELRGRAHLTTQENTQLQQLNTLLDNPYYRRCPECLGVGRVRFAYTSILTAHGFILAIADEDQPGHLPLHGIDFKTSAAAQAAADERK